MGAPELVRTERGAGRRRAAAPRLGGRALEPGDRRRGARVPRRCGALRRDELLEAGALRSRERCRFSSGSAPTTMEQPVGSVIYTQLCNERGGDRVRPDRDAPRPSTASSSSPAPRSGSTTSGGSASSRSGCPTATPSRCPTSRRRTRASGCGAHGARHPRAAHRVRPRERRLSVSPRERIIIGAVPVIAMRVTYVGELGWELYCPTEYGARACGTPCGMRAAARPARRRLPRHRRAAAREGIPRLVVHITPADNPYEAGLGFAVTLDKPTPSSGGTRCER